MIGRWRLRGETVDLWGLEDPNVEEQLRKYSFRMSLRLRSSARGRMCVSFPSSLHFPPSSFFLSHLLSSRHFHSTYVFSALLRRTDPPVQQEQARDANARNGAPTNPRTRARLDSTDQTFLLLQGGGLRWGGSGIEIGSVECGTQMSLSVSPSKLSALLFFSSRCCSAETRVGNERRVARKRT